MYLKNVGIFVKDLEGAKKFFESYFHAKVLKTFDNPDKGYYSYILELDGQAWIELMTKPESVEAPKDPNRTGLAHICFKIDTREELFDYVQYCLAKGKEEITFEMTDLDESDLKNIWDRYYKVDKKQQSGGIEMISANEGAFILFDTL